MIRFITAAAAASVLTTGAVAALADTVEASPKVTIEKTGDYCLNYGEVTGSRLPQVECHSQTVWAKQGVTFARR